MRLGLERCHLAAAALQQLADGGLHVTGANAVESGQRCPADIVLPFLGVTHHLIPSAARTGSVSGRMPRHSVKDSAACSTSMPQPLWARAQPCSMAQLTKGVALLL